MFDIFLIPFFSLPLLFSTLIPHFLHSSPTMLPLMTSSPLHPLVSFSHLQPLIIFPPGLSSNFLLDNIFPLSHLPLPHPLLFALAHYPLPPPQTVLFPDSLQHVLGEYGLVRPISVDAEGRFLSHAVSADRMAGGQSRRRRRREVGVGNDEWGGPRGAEEDHEPEAHQERLYFNVTVFGRVLHLRLHHNARLVAPGAKMEWRDDSDSTRHSEPLHDDCLYVGDITDTPGATVAISNCDGLVSGAVLPVLLSLWLLFPVFAVRGGLWTEVHIERKEQMMRLCF